MYLCVRGMSFAFFYDFSIGFWNFPNSVVFLVFHFITAKKGLTGKQKQPPFSPLKLNNTHSSLMQTKYKIGFYAIKGRKY